MANSLADILSRPSNSKDDTRSSKILLSAAISSATACQYLPGGDKYNDFLDSKAMDKPRGNKSVVEWLDEWDKKWDAISGSSKASGKTGLVLPCSKYADDVSKKNQSSDL